MRIIIFILLKLAEIAVLVIIPYGVGSVYLKIKPDLSMNKFFGRWWIGFACIVLSCPALFGLLIVAANLYMLISYNWEWAGRIIK